MENKIIILLILTLLGLFDTMYISYHQLVKKTLGCFFLPNDWCIKVLSSSYSKILGIPISYLGLLSYTLILLLISLYLRGLILFWPMSLVITIGFLFSIFFIYIQAVVLKAFCTWCVLSNLNFYLMFVVALFF